nr:lachesin-like [Penaeus vannamei]
MAVIIPILLDVDRKTHGAIFEKHSRRKLVINLKLPNKRHVERQACSSGRGVRAAVKERGSTHVAAHSSPRRPETIQYIHFANSSDVDDRPSPSSKICVTREDENTWTLHIRQVTPADTGYYVCQVNMEPTINQVGYVQVVVPPEFIDEESSASHVAVQEGNDVRLVCRAKGVPRPSIHWTREDGKTFTTVRGNQVKRIESEELVLNGVTRKDMGAYLCIASNKVPPSISKRIVLEIHFQPLITVPNQLVGAPIDTTVTLECHVSAFPNAVHFWRFKGQLLINSTRQETQEIKNGYKTTMRLSLRNLRGSDFGTYVCAAKNSLGETESTVRLYGVSVGLLRTIFDMYIH